MSEWLPDSRLRVIAQLIAQGMVETEAPIVTRIARGAGHTDEAVWPASKRIYRFLPNERLNHRTLRKGSGRLAQQSVAAQTPEYLVIAVDPVNFEKAYAERLERVSHVIKSTPKSRRRETLDAGRSRQYRDDGQLGPTCHDIYQLVLVCHPRLC